MENDIKTEQPKEHTERRFVIPGEILGDGRAGHGTYFDGSKVCSKFIGLAEFKNGMHFVIPLGGVYNPKKGDGIIGRIENIIFSKWIIDINSPYEAAMTLSDAIEEFVDLTKTDLTKYFDFNDIIFAEIATVSKTKQISLSMKSLKCRKLRGGRLIKVTPSKVPRIIGKGGSMVEMIKNITRTHIVVGQNGIVWVKGENEDMATEAILLIEEKSHIKGLTDYIKEMLENRLGSQPPVSRPVMKKDEQEDEEEEFQMNEQ